MEDSFISVTEIFVKNFNLSSEDRYCLRAFMTFLGNKWTNPNPVQYGLLVVYKKEWLEKQAIDDFEACFKEAMRSLPAEFRYELIGANADEIGRINLKEHIKPNRILVIKGCSSQTDSEKLTEALKSQPGLVSIVFASEEVVNFLMESDELYYRVLPRHIHLQPWSHKEVTHRFLQKLKKTYKTTSDYDKEIAYYNETIYKDADKVGDSYINDLMLRTLRLMGERKGITAYQDGTPLDSSFVPYSKKVIDRKEAESAALNPEPPKAVIKEKTKEDELNLLLLGLSTFPPRQSESVFIYEEKEYSGRYYYQLEPVPRVLCGELAENGDTLDGILALSTPDTQNMVSVSFSDPEAGLKAGDKISPWDYFQKKVKPYVNGFFNDEDAVKGISITPDEPVNGISLVVDYLRALDRQYKAINLYIDDHGGFRGTQLVAQAIVSLLETENIHIKTAYSVEYDPSVRMAKVVKKKDYQVFDFVSGIKEFVNYGRINSLKYYYERPESGGEDANTQDLLKTITDISDAIQTCNVKRFEDKLDELKAWYTRSGDGAQTDPYLALFRNTIKNDYGILLSANRNAFTEIEWCLRKGFYQQSLTIAEARVPVLLYENEAVVIYNDQNARFIPNNAVQKQDITTKCLNEIINGYAEEDNAGTPVESDRLFSRSQTEYTRYLTTSSLVKRDFSQNNEPLFSRRWKTEINKNSRSHKTYYIELDTQVKYDLYAFLYLHKALKVIRNESNHASVDGSSLTIEQLETAIEKYLEWGRDLLISLRPTTVRAAVPLAEDDSPFDGDVLLFTKRIRQNGKVSLKTKLKASGNLLNSQYCEALSHIESYAEAPDEREELKNGLRAELTEMIRQHGSVLVAVDQKVVEILGIDFYNALKEEAAVRTVRQNPGQPWEPVL